ncbi:hypothetical protein EYE36_23865 [Escherichia coli]|nr:hypothetical protein [Escherichia coli]RRO73829.1 hypothetical protein AWE53_002155 [Escherichia coli]RWU70542.1 hypothetical protein EPS42_17885 [Shigella sonnei]
MSVRIAVAVNRSGKCLFDKALNCPLTDFGGKTCFFSHPVYLFLRKFSLQDFRGGSLFTRKFHPFSSTQVAEEPLFIRR